MAQLQPHEHAVVEGHLRRIAMGGDDASSIEYLDFLGQLARGKAISTSDPLLARLVPYEGPRPKFARSEIPPVQKPARGQGLTPPAATERTAHEKQLVRKKHYVYGSHCAFMFELDWLKVQKRSPQQNRTITIEAARQVAPRSYDWDSRISFQLTQLELPQFAAVMFGSLGPEQVWAVGNHGRLRDKFLRAKEQDESVFLKLSQAGTVMPIRVGQEHRYPIIALAFEALKHNHDHLDPSTIRKMVLASLPRTR